MKQWWSIPEVCIWASTHDHAAVDAVSDNDADHFMGLDLLGDALLSDDDGAHVAAWKRHLAGTAKFPTRSDVVHELPQLFRCGELIVYGRWGGEGGLVPIPSDEWSLGLDITASRRHGSWIAYMPTDPVRLWEMLRVPSADALRVWPPIDSPCETKDGPQESKGRPGHPRYAQELVESYLAKHYPKPKGYTGTAAALQREMEAANKHVGATSISRALGRRPDKDRSSKRPK